MRGFPKTSGSRGIHINVRIEPKWDVPGGAPLRAGARSRGRAPHAAGDDGVVEGRAARRVHRLQPERAGPHGGVGVLGPADAGRARVVPA